ncbi:MAG: hypothetical protein L6R37_000882 [Teloschistes peruensis]|nr:MAG: hypothetical protein L6R37_000882 [Teloschistes peruensis]
MFAVTGWSVSASQLKTQQELDANVTVNPPQHNGRPAPSEQKSKKRKRDRGRIKGTEVTEDNVVELWQKHIEGRDPVRQVPQNKNSEKRERKRKRKERSENGENGPDESTTKHEQEIHEQILAMDVPQKAYRPSKNQYEASTAPTAPSQDGKAKYDQRKAKAVEKAQRRKSQPPPPQPSETPPITIPEPPPSNVPAAPSTIALKPPPAPAPQPTTKLTPLQTGMRAKLISARFRHLNQTLYTTPSFHASALFSSDPEAYDSYHAGFRAQVASWPQNPVDIFIREIRTRGAAGGAREKGAHRRKGKGGKEKGKGGVADGTEIFNGEGNVKIDPLPRSGEKSTILDLGCGDALLHASLSPHAPSLNLSIHSFDLSPGSGPNAHLVTVADIAHLPVADSSADVAIFCLALMGTNWVDYLAEAARVIRVGGECWVGEVKSRFAGAQEISKVMAGDKKKSTKKKKKRKGDVDEDEDDEELGPLQVEEETNMANGKQGLAKGKETDVGPFLGVFERRGFALKGEVDMRNKMFVRMRFVRIRDAVKGDKRKDSAMKYIDSDGGVAVDKEAEARVLKPCVYKTR